MWSRDVLSIFDGPFARPYVLAREIWAVELAPEDGGAMRLGPVSKIPAGAGIECCGQGFNERTVKVRWRGKLYFAFQQDLEAQDKPAARHACCQG